MSHPVLLIEKNDGVAVLTMNRPEAMNALNGELCGVADATHRIEAEALARKDCGC